MTTLYFVVPGDINTRTGGYRYDNRIIEELRSLGWKVILVTTSQEFPNPSRDALNACAAQMESIPDGSLVVIDGLAFSAAPNVFQHHELRLNLIALIHHPLALETGLSKDHAAKLKAKETRALAFAKHIITTSNTTVNYLKDYQIATHKISVVSPGTDKANLSQGQRDQGPLQFLCVASFIPRKGHRVLFDALRSIHSQSWHLNCAGNTELDKNTFEEIVELANDLELSDKITLLGVLDDEQLEQQYQQADVFVMASYFEGYGMVFDEAIAHGLPIIATTGGATQNTVPAAASILVPPGDSVQLADALEQFLGDDALKVSLREGAQRARERLRSWQLAAQEFSKIISQI